MKINKKAETASKFLISSIIAVSLLIIMGSLVSYLSNLYSRDDIDYFEGYDDVYGNVTGVGKDFVGDYDLNQNDTNIDIDRTEDFLFFKTFEIIRKIPKILTGVTVGINRISKDLMIPPAFTYLVIMVLGILLITSIVKIVRGFKDV